MWHNRDEFTVAGQRRHSAARVNMRSSRPRLPEAGGEAECDDFDYLARRDGRLLTEMHVEPRPQQQVRQSPHVVYQHGGNEVEQSYPVVRGGRPRQEVFLDGLVLVLNHPAVPVLGLQARRALNEYRDHAENPKSDRIVRNYLKKMERYNLVRAEGHN